MKMMHKVNVALQVLPRAKDKDTYALVDEAIGMIAASGLKYQVCPFETVIEGGYDEVMALVKKVHEACYQAGTETMMTYMKIQTSATGEVRIEDKMEKYS